MFALDAHWLDKGSASSWREPLALLLLCVAPLVWLSAGIFDTLLFDVDEGAFSEATREMIASGDWWHTTLQGQDRFDKPMGVYWLQALAVKTWGLHEWVLRLPSVLACWITALALGHFAWKRWGTAAGLMAGLIHSTSLGPWAMAHAATADSVLGLWLVLTALDLGRFLLDGAQVHHIRRTVLWVGLGVLTKGPIALLIPVATFVIWSLLQRSSRHLWLALRDIPSWLILLALCVPWYGYALWRHGEYFVQGFWVQHNVHRFGAAMEGHGGAWYYYLAVAPLLWMPWSPLLLTIGRKVNALWSEKVSLYALVWSGFVLIFFSLSRTKLPHYILYAAPGVTLLLVQASRQASVRAWVVCTMFLMAWLAGLTGFPGLLQRFAHLIPDTRYQTLLQTANAIHEPLAFAMGGVGLMLACWCAFAYRLRFVVIGYAMASVVCCLVLGVTVLPWWGQTLQGPVRALALLSRERPEVVVQWGGNWPSFAVYRQHIAPQRMPEPGEMALVRSNWHAVPAHWPVIAQERGMALVQRPVNDLREKN